MAGRFVVLVLALALAGCSEPTEGNEPTGSTPPATTAATSSTTAPPGRLCPPDCFQGHDFVLRVALTGPGLHEVGVPFPHGSWCLQPDEWTLGGSAPYTRNATGELRQVDRGWVLWVTGHGNSNFEARVDVQDRTECQTFRYDPWSIEPDPADGTVDVLSNGTVHVQVSTDDQNGACGTMVLYRGSATTGWTALVEDGRGTYCA